MTLTNGGQIEFSSNKLSTTSVAITYFAEFMFVTDGQTARRTASIDMLRKHYSLIFLEGMYSYAAAQQMLGNQETVCVPSYIGA